jgi:TctA family transporter
LCIAFIGYDVISGAPRFDFGNINLSGGISLIPAMIGFYAIPEVIKALARDGAGLPAWFREAWLDKPEIFDAKVKLV